MSNANEPMTKTRSHRSPRFTLVQTGGRIWLSIAYYTDDGPEGKDWIHEHRVILSRHHSFLATRCQSLNLGITSSVETVQICPVRGIFWTIEED